MSHVQLVAFSNTGIISERKWFEINDWTYQQYKLNFNREYFSFPFSHFIKLNNKSPNTKIFWLEDI